MTGPPNFQKHLFISYAHIDNQPLVPDQKGWVSRFHSSLEAVLSMRMGRKAEIWRDEKLTPTDIFADEIVAQFPKTALLVSVLTPRYVESEWCNREVQEFCRAAEQSGGVVVENKSRIIKVIKMPVDTEDPLPPVMRSTLGYPFYIFQDGRVPIELDPAFGPEIAQKYNLKVAELAWEVAQLVKKLEAVVPNEKAAAIPVSSKPSVYLAECSWDQRQAREALETELRLQGYPILPDRPLPREEASYVAEVARLLERCKLSIHLVGGSYGAVPDGPSQKSVVMLQNELATRGSRSGLQRVIWLPEGTVTNHSEQQRFIEALHNDPEAQFGADLITADLETLKAAMLMALQKRVQPESPNGGEKLIYLICEERDRRATIPIRKFLKDKGYEVPIPAFEGDAATMREANQDLLAQCDAIIVFYGAGAETWKRAVNSDLKRMKAYRGEKPLLSSYTYLGEPSTHDKEELIDLEEPNLINGLGGFSEEAMRPFLKDLEKG